MQDLVSPPPLHDETVVGFLASRGQGFERTIRRMETVERWALDAASAESKGKAVNPAIQERLERLSRCLGGMALTNCQPGSEEMVDLLAYLHSGRAFALLAWADETWPGQGASVVDCAIQGVKDGGESAYLLLDRLNHLDRMFVLSQVFSPASMREVLEILTELRGAEEPF